MKKVLLSAVALLAFGFANAQEEEAKTFGFAKGDMFVEGNINFSTVKEDLGNGFEDTANSFNFNPKAGYFLTDKIALGVELGVGSSKLEESSPGGSDESTSNNFGAGVFARYYFLDLGQRFKTYTEAGLGFGSRKWETNGVETQKDSNFGLGIDLGIQYFVTPKMAINFGLADVLSFQSGKSEFPGGGETKTTELNGNFNVFNNFFSAAQFGLTYKF
ncbi:outer membrane beta-barrel protein [Flavobacterium sp. LMO8]|uniref:porin family protein n=1 Tax=Flavobacterium sp. LMO8 TaxID=2654244 RepID=UPI00129265D3|nr:porin family protein [Flavobacterium sp. LMO8]MQP23752.1 outer membrane beta-barrel protein [Flavobacterium sp. LMO8]